MKNTVEYWFIKFYSPMCSHCHVMSPAWRQLASDLNAVIKVAAVNCEEDWVLCRKEGISSYPSLVLYPNVTQLKLSKVQVFNLFFFFFLFRKKNIMEKEQQKTCKTLSFTNYHLNQLKYQVIRFSKVLLKKRL